MKKTTKKRSLIDSEQTYEYFDFMRIKVVRGRVMLFQFISPPLSLSLHPCCITPNNNLSECDREAMPIVVVLIIVM